LSVIEHQANGGEGPSLLATGDPVSPAVNPLILNNAYGEVNGVNLRCTLKHLEAVFPENKLVTVTTFCNETDYPGVTKYHFRATFYMDFSPGSVYQTLSAALAAYQTNGTPCPFKARPYASQVSSPTNPQVSGLMIPQPFMVLGGDAGAASECQIDWNLTGPPSYDTGAVTATGATAGAPGYYTPSGANVPANLAALTGITANPATNWAAGQYVILGDLTGANWNGTAWVAGKHP
jgi:hypothetical protein